MNHVRNRLRRLSLAILCAGGLAALALASLAGGVKITAPASVVAGQSIIGYVTGGQQPMVVFATNQTGAILTGSPVTAPTDPVYFSFPTTEAMAGTIVTIVATSADPSSATASVVVK